METIIQIAGLIVLLVIAIIAASLIVILFSGRKVRLTYETTCDCNGQDNWCPECNGTGKIKNTIKLSKD